MSPIVKNISTFIGTFILIFVLSWLLLTFGIFFIAIACDIIRARVFGIDSNIGFYAAFWSQLIAFVFSIPWGITVVVLRTRRGMHLMTGTFLKTFFLLFLLLLIPWLIVTSFLSLDDDILLLLEVSAILFVSLLVTVFIQVHRDKKTLYAENK